MTTAQASRGAGDLRGLSKRDWTIVTCGAIVLVASFLPWEAASASALGTGYSASDSAWNAGFTAWFGSLLCAAAAVAVAARHLGYKVGIRGIGPNLAVCGLAAGGAALLVIRLLTLPRGSGYGVLGTSTGSYGPSFGAFAGVALAVVQAIVTLANLRASGERLPSMAAAGTQRDPAQSYQPTEAAQQPYPQSGRAYTEAAQPYQDHELAQRLGRLDQLRNSGMISESEYAEQRRRIINQL
jgi:putative oligomerization/nucleic acid binding protein